jgi:catechol 2,3-dioxygenase-like lactoylglutathione lyase family enzyme
MITRMSHATVWVKNQQEALEFYRDKLGFEVDTDAMVGDDFRWLTMRIPSQPGFEIILMEPKPGYILDEESAAQLKALMEKGRARWRSLRNRRHPQDLRGTKGQGV